MARKPPTIGTATTPNMMSHAKHGGVNSKPISFEAARSESFLNMTPAASAITAATSNRESSCGVFPRDGGAAEKTAKQPSLKLVRRMEQIENLPVYQQRALLTTIDTFIAAAEGK
jgi:hypothetical protein